MNKQEIKEALKRHNSLLKKKQPNRKKEKKLRRKEVKKAKQQEEMKIYFEVLKAKREYEEKIKELDLDGAIQRTDEINGDSTGQ